MRVEGKPRVVLFPLCVVGKERSPQLNITQQQYGSFFPKKEVAIEKL
jgi:hypothetical protein